MRFSPPPPVDSTSRTAVVTSGCWWWWARTRTRTPGDGIPRSATLRWGRTRREARGSAAPRAAEAADEGASSAVDVVDVEAHVDAALARILADASNQRPATAGLEGEDKSQKHRQRGETRVANRARPKTGEVKTCRHWAKGWCTRADACRFTHSQPPVAQGVPEHPHANPRDDRPGGALRLSRSDRHEELLHNVVEAAQGGGLQAVGYAVAHAGMVVWAVALPCGVAALLTPFPVVPWRDMVSL